MAVASCWLAARAATACQSQVPLNWNIDLEQQKIGLTGDVQFLAARTQLYELYTLSHLVVMNPRYYE